MNHGRLVGYAKHALQLLCANAPLAGAHQVHSLEPDIQSDFAALKDRADSDRELIGAGAALVNTGACGRALQVVMAIHNAAMRADNPTGPAQSLKVLAGLFCVLEVGLVKDCFSHDAFSNG